MKHSLLVPALALCSLQASAGDWHSEVTTAIESGKFKEAKAIMNAQPKTRENLVTIDSFQIIMSRISYDFSLTPAKGVEMVRERIPGVTDNEINSWIEKKYIETMTIDGTLFRFIDTAGLRETSDEVEKIGISRSYKKMNEASIVLALLDVTASEEENEYSISDIVSNLDVKSQKLIVLLNKVDVLGNNINVSLINNSVSNPNEKVVKLYISAKTGFGLDELRKLLSDSQKSATLDSDQTIVTNLRHYQALMKASESLENVKRSLAAGQTPDLLSEDLRQALHHLGTIIGEVTTDEVLGNIFEHFCIGK